MVKMMIIKRNNISTMWSCPNFKHKADINYKEGTKPNNESIPIFYSKEEAKKEGWVFTSHPMWCPPNEVMVAVCPECVKEFNLKTTFP